MRRTIKRMPLVNIYDITQMEAYFTHMASKGFFVKKATIFTSFEKGEPKEIKYRLEPYNDMTKEPPQEMLFLYEEQGWEYVCKFNYFHLFQSKRADATEIHTYPVVQGETFDKICRDLRDFFWFASIILFVTGGAVFYSTFYNYPIYSSIRFGTRIGSYMTIIMYILFFCQSLQNYRKIKKLKQQLESGVGIVHNETYKRQYRHYFSLVLPLVLLFVMFSISHYADRVDFENNLSEYKGKLPTISITELENGPNLPTVYADESLGAYGNYISYYWSELAPQGYHIEQEGQYASGTYCSSVETEYYSMRFQFLAKPLYEEMLDDQTDNPYYEKIEYKELADTKFDQAMLVTTENSQMFFGQIEDKVIFIRYYGEKDLEDKANAIFEAVINFEKDDVVEEEAMYALLPFF